MKLIFTLSGGLVSLVGLTIVFGDVDDNWFLYILSGTVVGFLVSLIFHKKEAAFESSPLLKSMQNTLLGLFLVLLVYGGYGSLTNVDLLTRQKYDGMAGMLPYLALLLAVPIILIWLVIFWTRKKRARADHQ